VFFKCHFQTVVLPFTPLLFCVQVAEVIHHMLLSAEELVNTSEPLIFL